MKVFKFKCGEHFYVFAAMLQKLAEDLFIENVAWVYDSVEEIPESEWDNMDVNVWVDNDTTREPFKASIRELINGDEPQLLYTTDL